MGFNISRKITGRYTHAATGRGPTAFNQGRKNGPVESAYLGSSFEVSGVFNIATTCLLKQNCKVVEEMEVPIMMGEGFVYLNN